MTIAIKFKNQRQEHVSLTIHWTASIKKNIEEKKKREREQFFQKITCPNLSLNQEKFNHNLGKKNYYKKIPPQLQGKHSSASRLLAL